MKRLLIILAFHVLYFSVHGSPTLASCDDDISVIQNHFQISFGDTVTAGIATDLTLPISWKVFPQTGINKTSGSGKNTGNLIFSQPGEYQIVFDIPAHGEHPAKTETVTVQVSDVKMMFDTKNIRFSKQLTTGDASGIVMTVPVQVKTYGGRPYDYTARELQTTGVSKVTSRLNGEKAVLEDGLNELSFELSGTISQQGNIQFRIYDTKGEAVFFNYSIEN